VLLSPFLEPPDTSGYMLVGYIVFIVLPLLFILSLILRRRNLEKDEAAIQSLTEDEQKK
jgi:DMSO/TMAO reductase YedYZ heme-binding membrane subunit